MSRLSILVIGPTPPPYHGVAVAIETLLNSRFRDVFDVAHLELADRRGIGHVNQPDLHDVWLFLRQWVRLWRLLFARRPQAAYLVLSQTTIGFLRDSLLMWPAVLMGARIIVHVHGGAFRDWYESRWSIMQAYVRAVLSLVSKMIVLGDSLRGMFDGLLPDDRVAVVPNGVEIPWDEPAHDYPCGTRPWRILHLNTLNRMKGTLVLLAAIPTILRNRKDVAFIFAGSWSHSIHRRVAEWYIAQHRLQPYVTFLGEVTGEAKDECLRDADIFVFPGVQQEGQPMVVLEAMAAGLPIVFTNQGCLRETVVNGECGVEVYVNDPYDLAMRICALLEHPEDQRRFGRNARRRCQLLYDKARHIERMINVFEDALAPAPSSRRTSSLTAS